MADRTGWVKHSNEQYAAELREEDRKHKAKHGKNSGKTCDACAMDDHERCWRVVCYCPCVRDKVRGDAWPARQTVL